MRSWFAALLTTLALLFAGPACADGWTAIKLRGAVLAGDPVGQAWTRLARGDSVADNRVIRTLANGNAVFRRGSETVAFGPNTQAEIIDRRSARPFTTVVQQFGEVAVSADVRRVQHFAVSTPYLVAVVKGTQFTVATNPMGSTVVVQRGLVAVTGVANHRTVNVAAGQSLTAAVSGALTLSGQADAALTHPVINGLVEDSGETGLLTDLGDTVTGLTGILGNSVSGVGGTVGDVSGDLGSTVGGLAGSLGRTVTDVTGTVDNTVTSTTATVGNTVGSVGGTVGGALQNLGL